MIYRVPEQVDRDLLQTLDTLRDTLAQRTGTGRPEIRRLRRTARTTAWSASTSIEGYQTPDDADAIANREVDGPQQDPDRAALACYALAMAHVATLARDPHFRWLDRVLLDLHFVACSFQTSKDPGLWRTGPMQVTRGHQPNYVAPDADQVPELMDALLDRLRTDTKTHPAVSAAMAHLNLVSIHPFRDGNGRMARILQSLVLARQGPLPPELGSIEPFLARSTDRYYNALIAVQADRWSPDRDAGSWVHFCLEAHVEEARARLDQLDEGARRWERLTAIVEERSWPDRLVSALELACFGPVTRSRYATETDVSETTASHDLRRLADAGWLVARGAGRGARYVASDALRMRLTE